MTPGSQLKPIAPEIYQAIGQLCSGWSSLEYVTEHLTRGILQGDNTTTPEETWRLSLRDRWKLILKEAPKKHNGNDLQTLETINERIPILVKDRNIIIHGLIHMWISNPQIIDGKVVSGIVERVPAVTIFRGSEAGKNFPISEQAVRIVYANVLKVNNEIYAFNKDHGYTKGTIPSDELEQNWPIPL